MFGFHNAGIVKSLKEQYPKGRRIVNRRMVADKLRNIRFVEENFDKINQDKFFRTDYGFEEVYYNPDSSAGG